MKFRNTLILLAILAALVAYVLLVETNRPSPEADDATPPPTPLPPVLSFDPADARALRLSRPAEDRRTELALQKDGRWRVTAPVEEEADQGKVIRLLDAMAALRPSRVLTGTLGPLSDYELDPPVLSVEIELTDQVVHGLTLGAKTATGSAYYGQIRGDEHVYLLPFSLGADVERYLDNPPVKPTPMPTLVGTKPATIPPPPTATPAS